MRRKDRDDIERNKIYIITMANLLHSILQVPNLLSSFADPVATPHTTPAVGDIYDPFVTTKRPVRHAFVTSKTRRRWKVMTEVGRRTVTWLVRV